MRRALARRLAVAFLALLVAPASRTGAEEDPVPPGASPPPVVRQVGEVTVTTRRAERGVLETPGNVTVIDRPAIERSGARDVPDLLRREAGIFVTNDSGNPEGYRVEARGFNNGGGNGSGTLVLVDGRRAFEPRSDVMDWSLLPLDRVERIEIVRGPASALWGDGAEGGVIQVITRDGEGPPRFEARGSLGSYQNWGSSLFGGGSAGPVTASLFAHDAKDGGYRDRSLFRSHGVEGKLGFELGERARLALKSGYTSDQRNRPGTLDELQKESDRRQAEPSNDENFLIARQWYVDGRLELVLAEDVTFTSVAWYRERTDDGAVGTATSAFTETLDTWSMGVNNQLEVASPVLGHANQLVVGGDWARERFQSDSLFDFFAFPPPSEGSTRAKRYLYGFFLQDDFHLTEDLILSAGVRYDRNHREGTDLIPDPTGVRPNEFATHQSAWSPRGAVTWRVLDPVSLYASYAQGFRFPNLDEAFGVFGFAPFLDPEKSKTYEVGAVLRTARASANLALYTMNVRDEIYFDTEQAFPFGENVNLDRVRHRGVEASANLRPWDWLELYGSYTFDDVKVTRDELTGLEGQRMPIVPRHRGTAGFLFLLPCDVELGMNGNFVAPRYAVNDVANAFPTLSRYAVYDARAAWRPKIGEHLRLGIIGIVYNVFDREYSEVGGIRTFFDPTIPPFGDFARQRRFFPAPERNWEVRLVIEVLR